MKFLSVLLILITSLSVQATIPIYVGGEKHSYNESHFEPITVNNQVIGYQTSIDVHIDQEDPYYGYPELIFDITSELAGSVSGRPMILGMTASCGNGQDEINVGSDVDLIIERAGQIRNARFSLYKRETMYGVCKKLNIKIEKIASSRFDTNAVIDSFNMDVIVHFRF